MILTEELEEVGRRTRVLRDRVLVKILPYVHPTLATPGIEINKGVVIAVGYGRRQRRKVAFKQEISEGPPVLGPGGTVMKFAKSQLSGKELWFEDGPETGAIIPMQVKPGDVVEFSFRNITLVDFDQVGFPGIGHLAFVWQKAIYSVDPDESLQDCLLWQESAGYDRHGNFMSGSEDWHRA
jgi:co-chaperonin GroES (HSP10)